MLITLANGSLEAALALSFKPHNRPDLFGKTPEAIVKLAFAQGVPVLVANPGHLSRLPTKARGIGLSHDAINLDQALVEALKVFQAQHIEAIKAQHPKTTLAAIARLAIQLGLESFDA